MVKHTWPLLEISFSDFRRLAALNINTYLPTYLPTYLKEKKHLEKLFSRCLTINHRRRNQGGAPLARAQRFRTKQGSDL